MAFDKTILIVEKNGTTGRDTQLILTDLGYTVSGMVSSGEAALQEISVTRPGLILMSIHLKGELDGIETAMKINADHKIPIVYTTNLPDDNLIERLKQTNPYGYITKPYESAELHTVIDVAFYKKEMEAEFFTTQKHQSVEMLAGGISHQFNNALAVVMGNINLIEMDYADRDNLERSIREIKKSTNTMTRLTSQLLAFAGGGKYQTSVISLNDFLNETLPIINSVVNSSLHVGVKLPDEVLYTSIDINQLQSALSAILINASEAMMGNGLIHITCEGVTITDRNKSVHAGLKPGEYVRLAIKDSGVGMEPETVDRVFEPFFSTKFEGRGLGMAAANGIITNHGGILSIKSAPNEGSTVNIFLPATDNPVKTEIIHAYNNGSIAGKGVVMLIDDNESIVEMTTTILNKIGYSVIKTGSGIEALNVIQNNETVIDIVLLDIVMPDMTGEELYPKIKNLRPDLPVIVFSGYSIDSPVRKVLDAGAVDFIQKPFTVKGLAEKIKSVLNKPD